LFNCNFVRCAMGSCDTHQFYEGFIDIRRLCIVLVVTGKIIKIEITDSGPGIPNDKLIKIFTPFFTTKKQGKGTGLGLFVSHEMARKLGGDIKVISSTGDDAINSGTVFTVELPIE